MALPGVDDEQAVGPSHHPDVQVVARIAAAPHAVADLVERR
jgi:hypothetical protein